MRLIANCQLTGDYGTVVTGQEFMVPDPDGLKLLASGAARRAITYESKPARYEMPSVTPEAPGVSARPPFRDLPGFDAEPPALATVRSAVRSVSDVSEQGNSDTRGRGRRKTSDSK